jgi:hypothetical protein
MQRTFHLGLQGFGFPRDKYEWSMRWVVPQRETEILLLEERVIVFLLSFCRIKRKAGRQKRFRNVQ